VITGEPEQVRQLLAVVKHELERNAARRDHGGRRKSIGSGKMVRPTDLDEMDSPYVLPEAMVMPVDEPTGELMRTPVDEETVDDPRRRVSTVSPRAPQIEATKPSEPAFSSDSGPTLNPPDSSTDPEVKSN
jgi:hypothetical protein